jgi:hypothetical protein
MPRIALNRRRTVLVKPLSAIRRKDNLALIFAHKISKPAFGHNQAYLK